MIRTLIFLSASMLTAAALAGDNIKISVNDAIMMGLENNRSLKIQKLAPLASKTYEDESRSAFDPTLKADISRQKSDAEQILTRSGGGLTNVTSKEIIGNVGIEENLPTGTKLALEGKADLLNSSLYSGDFDSTRAGISITQSLLQGLGTGTGLAALRQARLDTRISEFELKGFAEQLVAAIESSCWDYILAGRQVEIYNSSLKLAEQQLSETKERIAIGDMASAELPAAEAEAAMRKEALITAQGSLETSRLELIHLLAPPAINAFELGVEISDIPAVTNAKLDNVSEHINLALKMRPDLNQAKLKVSKGELEVVKTKNGLLPKLDLFMKYGNTGYGSSFSDSSGNINGDHFDMVAGLQLEYQIGDRASSARNKRAKIGLEQSAEALTNLSQLVELDVRSAYIDFNNALERSAASAATLRHRQESLKVESEKFKVGKSTSLLVAQAQRDLLSAQIQELTSTINCAKALINLYRLEGSLLDRRGLSVVFEGRK